MSRSQSIALAVVVAILAGAVGVLLSRAMLDREGGKRPYAVTGTLLDPPRPLPEISLVDHEGKPFGADRLRGHWSLLFFGFTSCPDVCPTTLAALAQMEKLLADLPAAARPQVVLISVDPERDTPERLAAYVKSFDPSFVGATAAQGVVEKLAEQLGVVVSITKGENGSYDVNHSAAVFLIDPNGAIRTLFTPPHDPKLIADDFRHVTQPVSTTGGA